VGEAGFEVAGCFECFGVSTKFGERAFSHASPTAWNLLPVNIRAETSQIKF